VNDYLSQVILRHRQATPIVQPRRASRFASLPGDREPEAGTFVTGGARDERPSKTSTPLFSMTSKTEDPLIETSVARAPDNERMNEASLRSLPPEPSMGESVEELRPMLRRPLVERTHSIPESNNVKTLEAPFLPVSRPPLATDPTANRTIPFVDSQNYVTAAEESGVRLRGTLTNADFVLERPTAPKAVAGTLEAVGMEKPRDEHSGSPLEAKPGLRPPNRAILSRVPFVSSSTEPEVEPGIVHPRFPAFTPMSSAKPLEELRTQPERTVAPAQTEPSIQVTIGRIEIRAITEASQPKRSAAKTPTLSLDEYLTQRAGGRR